MIQTSDTPLEAPQDPSLAPALPASSTPNIAPFSFAPAPTVPAPAVSVEPPVFTDQPLSIRRPAPLVRPRRRVRGDWYQLAVILLILSCAALCIYRLIWAVQP